MQNQIEAILFTIGREVSLQRLSALLDNVPQEKLSKELEILKKKYTEDKYSMHIVERPNGWKFTIKDKYLPLASKIVNSLELDRGVMETLAVIAWKYPLNTSDVVRLRSPAAYEHMKKLVELGFIKKERSGRTFKVLLTGKFFQYFDLPSNEAKAAFIKQVPQEILDEIEEIDKEIDVIERMVEIDDLEKSSMQELSNAHK